MFTDFSVLPQHHHHRHHQTRNSRRHHRHRKCQNNSLLSTRNLIYTICYQIHRPGLNAPAEFERKAMTENKKATIDKLKSRPRRRPDWSDMMKEVESGKKLRHVECNDRSKPILTCKSITNVSGQFIYETEKANVHNALLRQIQGGLRLKSVKTNDRSRPVLDGLRKFRRQMTIEEQIQKSESRAQLAQEVWHLVLQCFL